MLKAWSPASGIQGGDRAFRRWSPVGSRELWDVGLSPSLFASGPSEQLAPAQAPHEMVTFLVVCTTYLIKATQERGAHVGSGSEDTVRHSGEGVQPEREARAPKTKAEKGK